MHGACSVAEELCKLLAGRIKGAGFLKTLLLRRVGSTIHAGRSTAEKMLASWQDAGETAEEDDDQGEEGAGVLPASQWKTLTDPERLLLRRFVQALKANQERDPKYAVVLECLRARKWLELGCINFSQYFDFVD